MKHFFIASPVLNAVQWIDDAINSIVSQTGDVVIHYHVHDGGSTDGTIDRLKLWETFLCHDNPIVHCRGLHFSWHSEPDTGMYNALNRAFTTLDVPSDGIMSWLNADDMYLPHVFACLAKAFSDIPNLDYLAGDWHVVESTGISTLNCRGPWPQEVMREYCLDGLTFGASPPQPSVFWTGALWKKSGERMDENLRYAGDFELWGRLARHAECAYLPLAMSVCRRHTAQLGFARPYPASPTYYVLEREHIRSLEERRAFVKQFWRKRVFPPKATVLRVRNGQYVMEREFRWPTWWGKTLLGYFWRRISWRPRCFLRYIGVCS